MAAPVRKKRVVKAPAKKTGEGFGSRIRSWGMTLLSPMLCAVFFILGGVLTNLDRLPSLPPKLIGGSFELLPSPIRRVLARYQPQFARSIPQTELRGRIISVYDGDTATMLAEDGKAKYKLRFYGIDAPEAAQQGGAASGAHLRSLIDNRDVVVKVVTVDPYGRSVANVYCDGVWVNLQMVRDGHAWYYAAYAPRERELEQAMSDARLASRGLWHSSLVEPPWVWRKKSGR